MPWLLLRQYEAGRALPLREQLPAVAVPLWEKSFSEKGSKDGGTESAVRGFDVEKKRRYKRGGDERDGRVR